MSAPSSSPPVASPLQELVAPSPDLDSPLSASASASASPALNGARSPACPIPPAHNAHLNGAVDGRMKLAPPSASQATGLPHSFPRHGNGSFISTQAQQQGSDSQPSSAFLSPGPLYPKRFNDDSTDSLAYPSSSSQNANGVRSASMSPGRFPIRATSNPGQMSLGDANAGHTGNAPSLEAAQAAQQAVVQYADEASLAPRTAHHKHKAGPRPEDNNDDDDDTETTDAAEARTMYEKDERGVFQFAAVPPPAGGDMGGITKNRSKLNLASMGSGTGPRNPPVALVSSNVSLMNRGLSRMKDPAHPNSFAYNRVVIDYAPSLPSAEMTEIAQHVRKCLELRTKFVWTPVRDESQHDVLAPCEYIKPSLDDPLPPKAEDIHLEWDGGVFAAWKGSASKSDAGNQHFEAPNRAEFGAAMATVMDLVISGPAKTFCHNRLHILEARFNLHELLNHDIEQLVQKSVPHRDFYNVRKIDNHVHHSAAMNQKHLLRFIKSKLKRHPDEKVIIRDGKELTLAQVFDTLGMTAYDLNVDTLDMHADKTFHRFDKFNLKYNPVGESRLREIFLKYNNHIKGRYLAEITQQVFEDLESNKYQLSEYRLSIYGAKKNEWAALAAWVVDHDLFSANVRWMIQIPRLYSIYKASGQITNFGEMLHNIFDALFAVSIDPSVDPKLHTFLKSCVGFDLVDDESLRERPFKPSMPAPDQWDADYDPPYALFAYYIYANMITLNKLRAARGFTTFALRPHCGEAGDIEHLAAGFLLAKSINHGLMLQKSPQLQYLYYLSQIGLSMSPLSNNLLFLEYEKNPFPKFFKKGLNVTLSTDDPLMIHVTREPLVEEYSVAAQVWKLSAIDMSEIARNSVLQSGWEQRFKVHFIGNNYWLRGARSNDIRQTNLPDLRLQYRAELLGDEMRFLEKHAGQSFDESLIDRIM